MDRKELDRIINLCGGIHRVAELMSLSHRTIQGWRKKGIPQNRIVFLNILKEAYSNDAKSNVND